MTSAMVADKRGWVPWAGFADGEAMTVYEVEQFWAKVKYAEDGHWLHTSTAATPQTPLRGKLVAANRVAWALRYPDQAVPKLFRKKSCPHFQCINPDCFTPERPTRPTPPQPAAVRHGAQYDAGLSRMKQTIHPEDHELARDFLDEPRYRPPILPHVSRSTPGMLPVSFHGRPIAELREMLEFLFRPGVSVVTYPTGHVYVYANGVKADGDNGAEVLVHVMSITQESTP